jgi:hypothetical protein
MVSVVKMATILEYTTKGQHSVVPFFVGKRTRCKGHHKEMFPIYGGKCLWCKGVHNWVEKFSQGRSKVAGDVRPGHINEIAVEATVQWVDRLIRADRRLMIDIVATALGSSHGLACSRMHDPLKFRKMCTQWVPDPLNNVSNPGETSRTTVRTS